MRSQVPEHFARWSPPGPAGAVPLSPARAERRSVPRAAVLAPDQQRPREGPRHPASMTFPKAVLEHLNQARERAPARAPRVRKRGGDKKPSEGSFRDARLTTAAEPKSHPGNRGAEAWSQSGNVGTRQREGCHPNAGLSNKGGRFDAR